jgi:biopolymer transport protein ExbD
VVLAEKEASTGTLVQVIDQVRQGGIQAVSIAASGSSSGG